MSTYTDQNLKVHFPTGQLIKRQSKIQNKGKRSTINRIAPEIERTCIPVQKTSSSIVILVYDFISILNTLGTQVY